MARNQPTCHKCNGTGAGVEFPLFPMTAGESFGTICVTCDTTNNNNNNKKEN